MFDARCRPGSLVAMAMLWSLPGGAVPFSSALSAQEALDDLTELSLEELMQAPTDRLTWMRMAPYVELSMDHVTRSGREFSIRTKGHRRRERLCPIHGAGRRPRE